MQLSVRVIRGTLGLSFLNNLMMVINFSTQIALARLLTPEIFGTVALAFAILSFFELFLDWGTAAAVLQNDRSRDLADTLFTLRLIFCLLLAGLIGVAYMLLRPFYDAEVILTLVILSSGTVMVGLYDVFKAVMQKEMMLAAIGWTDLGSVLLSSLVALGLAYHGHGLWSLVSYHLLAFWTRGLGYMFISPFRPRLRFNREEARWFWKFGRNILLVGMMDRINQRSGEWFLGTVRGATELGIFSLAMRIGTLVQRMFLPVLHLTSLPAFSELKDQPDVLKKAYQFTVKNLIRILIPFCMLLGLYAPELITLLAGEDWSASAPIFRVLMLFAILSPLFGMHQHLFYALGHPEQFMKIKSIQVGLLIISMIPLTVLRGGVGLAISQNISFLLGSVYLLIQTNTLVSVPFRSILNTFTGGIIALSVSGLLKSYIMPVHLLTGISCSIFFFLLTYGLWLFISERKSVIEDISRLKNALSPSSSSDEKTLFFQQNTRMR